MQTEERLPQVTRFPQRAKSANFSENASEMSGKKQHVKRPSLELVDSHSFVTDEKDKNSKGPRIIETELSKSDVIETVSKASVEYASSSTTDASEDEDTTPLMEKFAIDLYAILANENAKEDDKKSKTEIDETTVASEDEFTTIEGEEATIAPITSTTTEATTTTIKTTTTTEAITTSTELPKGRGGLTAGRNRFKFQPKGPTSSTEAPTEVSTESTKHKNRFSRPSTSYSSRNVGSRTTVTTNGQEEVSKSDAPTQSTSSKLGAKSRNRFSLRNQSTTAITGESVDTESTTISRLVKPRPQFSLRNRGRNGQTASTTESSNDSEENTGEKEEKPVEKAASIVPKPTSRLNLNRPTSGRLLPGQKPRVSHLNPRRNGTADDSVEGNKSAHENESDFDTTTPNNLNKLKSRPRIQINADSKAAKKTTSSAAVNRKVNPLISKRKFGVTSTTGKGATVFCMNMFLQENCSPNKFE